MHLPAFPAVFRVLLFLCAFEGERASARLQILPVRPSTERRLLVGKDSDLGDKFWGVERVLREVSPRVGEDEGYSGEL